MNTASAVLSSAWAAASVPVQQLGLGGGGGQNSPDSGAPDADARRSYSSGEERVQALASAAALPLVEAHEDSDEDLAAAGDEPEAQSGQPFNVSQEGEAGSEAAPAEQLLQPRAALSSSPHPLSGPPMEAPQPAVGTERGESSLSVWACSLVARDAADEAAALAAARSETDPAPYRVLQPLLDRVDSDADAWVPPDIADAEPLAMVQQACRAALAEAADVHLRRVLHLMLREGGVPHVDSWVPVLASLVQRAAAMVIPAAGGAGSSMDPRDYLSIKRCPTGSREDSRIVAGVACRRNVAHRRMSTSVAMPRLLLLGGALQYQRVEGRLSSLETLLEQERAHLRVACARLAALRPHVILVEKSCARYAQELLLAHDVTLVLNVKPQVLRRLASATGAAVAPGADHLRKAHCGTCASFRVEPAPEEHGRGGGGDAAPSASGRTLMVFDGCPRPLSVTILLCGASADELAAVKAVTPWAVYAAHHLQLEGALLADQLAAAGTSAEQAAAAVAAAVAAAAASLVGLPATAISVSPFLRQSARLLSPPSAAAVDKWAFALVRAEERLAVSLSCRCPVRRTLCEPFNMRAIDHYGPTDVPLGSFLAAALPGPGRKCGCGEGPEAHVRSYAAAGLRLMLRVRPPDAALLGGGDCADAAATWHWSLCAACEAAGGSAPPRRRVRLSAASMRLSLGKFLALSLAAPDLAGGCGHSLHALSLRFFATSAGTACLSLTPQPRLALALPRRHPGPQAAGTLAALRADADELASAAAGMWAEVRSALRASCTEHAHLLTGRGEPPVLLAHLEATLEEEAVSFSARLAEALPESTDALALNRLRRSLAGSRRRWAQAMAELHASAWRSSFPVDAKRGWSADQVGGAEGGAEAAARPPAAAAASAPALAAQPTPSIGRALMPQGVGGVSVVVFDEEPTSVIAYALASAQYAQLLAAARASASTSRPVAAAPVGREARAALASAGVAWTAVASPEAAHVRCAFEEAGGSWGSSGGASDSGPTPLSASPPPPSSPAARFQVTQYFAPQFEALCTLWGVSSVGLLRSFCRCSRWESSGGKSGAYFAKTRDDAFVVKGLSRPELTSLLEVAPAYAAYAAAAAAADRPVLLAKLVGVFSVHVAVAGRRDVKLDLVMMENLFPGGRHSPVFDLKGVAGRARAAPEDAPVLLDENLVERAAMAEAPLVVSPPDASVLMAAVWRDTAFLARLGVMDYSLVAGLCDGRLAVGIVDYLRQYTWDKQLETYVKSSAVLALTGGGAQPQQPTVISPKEYARRFRTAMRSYFVKVGDVVALS